jgi:hypothetical protein
MLLDVPAPPFADAHGTRAPARGAGKTLQVAHGCDAPGEPLVALSIKSSTPRFHRPGKGHRSCASYPNGGHIRAHRPWCMVGAYGRLRWRRAGVLAGRERRTATSSSVRSWGAAHLPPSPRSSYRRGHWCASVWCRKRSAVVSPGGDGGQRGAVRCWALAAWRPVHSSGATVAGCPCPAPREQQPEPGTLSQQ